MNCVLIMAGGVGTRFWPKSTEDNPKQFLKLIGDKTMIQLTVERVSKNYSLDKIFVCTQKKYKNLVMEQLPELDEKNIILEPVGRNTAPCILLSTIYISSIFNGCNITVLPSDHVIRNNEVFLKNLEIANDFINKNKEGVVTIGCVPTRPETGYGYIKYQKNSDRILSVEKFVEKPDYETAIKYYNADNYLWNAGIFVFNANYILEMFKKFVPDMYNLLNTLPSNLSEKYYTILLENYSKCQKISFDYALMEKLDKIFVIPSDFGWDDVGTWNSIERYIDKDNNSNVINGKAILDNSQNCIVYGNDKKIILIDVKDLFIIDSDDAIVVCDKRSVDKVHEYKKNF